MLPQRVDQVDKYNRNIAFYASYACHEDRSWILRKVLELNANPRCPDVFGVTPLIAACRNGDANTVSILINKDYRFQNMTVPNPNYTKPPKRGNPAQQTVRTSAVGRLRTGGITIHGGAITPVVLPRCVVIQHPFSRPPVLYLLFGR